MGAPQPREKRTGRYGHKPTSAPEAQLNPTPEVLPQLNSARFLGLRTVPPVGNTVRLRPHTKGGYDRIERHPDGTTLFFAGEQLHREDGPALFRPDGTTEYWVEGKVHRDGAPAITTPGRRPAWFLRGRGVTNPIPEPPTVINGPAITEVIGAEFEDGALFKAIVTGIRYKAQQAARLGALPPEMKVVIRYDIPTETVFIDTTGAGDKREEVREMLNRFAAAHRRTTINRSTGALVSNFHLELNID